MYFMAFFLPYYMATWMNIAHQRYHAKMMATYLEVKIILHFDDDSSERSVAYLCKPGNIKCLQESSFNSTDTDERRPLFPQEFEQFQDTERVNELYKQYCWEALIVQGKANLSKVADFDFVPLFLNISIPLDSSGYTFTILLTLVSIVFSFVH